MLAQKIERIGWSLGVDSLGGIQGGLFIGLGLHALAPIQDGKIVVRSQIVGIDGLQRFKLSDGVIGVMLLVVGDAKLTARIARLRILFHDPL